MRVGDAVDQVWINQQVDQKIVQMLVSFSRPAPPHNPMMRMDGE